MIEEFLKNAGEKNLFGQDDKILLTVSGGADSVCMATLFAQTGMTCGIAHCNFGLRGPESDEDEVFVKNLAQKMGFPFYTIRFDTKTHAAQHRLSTQMAARTLRYTWFESLKNEHGYTKIATAHHADDFSETVLINLIRGSEYIKGIPENNGSIIRPLLFASRADIENYLGYAGLLWRNDSSNDEDHYLRNHLRHHVLPPITTIAPGINERLQQSAAEAEARELLLQCLAEEKKAACTVKMADGTGIKKAALPEGKAGGALLKILLNAYGFHHLSTEECLRFITTRSGKKLLSPDFRLYNDRDYLWLIPAHRSLPAVYGVIDNAYGIIENEYFKIVLIRETFTTAEPGHLYLSLKTVGFPLTVRRRATGDKYKPAGLPGSKKISDILIDNKIPEPFKDLYPVIVTTAGEIVGAVNYRAAQSFAPVPGEEAVKVTFTLK